MKTREIAAVAIFTATILGSNYALSGIPNVKLLDVLVFVSSFVFGLGVGISVAIISELAWSFLSPYGFAGMIMPFLVAGEIIYVLAGRFAAKVWGNKISLGSAYSFVAGSLLAICAFVWDFETNVGTAIIATWPQVTLTKIIAFQVAGLLFSLTHEISDFILGSSVAPIAITMSSKLTRG